MQFSDLICYSRSIIGKTCGTIQSTSLAVASHAKRLYTVALERMQKKGKRPTKFCCILGFTIFCFFLSPRNAQPWARNACNFIPKSAGDGGRPIDLSRHACYSNVFMRMYRRTFIPSASMGCASAEQEVGSSHGFVLLLQAADCSASAYKDNRSPQVSPLASLRVDVKLRYDAPVSLSLKPP